MIKPLSDLGNSELRGKKVLLRVDFNVPIAENKATENYRFRINKEAVDFLQRQGAVTVMVSHIAAVKSFEPILVDVKEGLGCNFTFIKNIDELGGALSGAKSGDLFLLDNIRQYEGEEKNDGEFAKKLAGNFDVYVNNAFSVSHRNHASITSVAKLLPSYGGPLLIKEIENLSKAMQTPKEDKVLILGGAKIGTKLPVIDNFIGKAEHILIGGVLANIFLKAKGTDIGKSLVDDGYLPQAKKLMATSAEIIIPEDFIIWNGMILDIGPKTVEKFGDLIKRAKTVIWNGPMGKAEVEELAFGTKDIARAVAGSGAFSVVGGGDTIAVLEKLNLINKIGYVSASGGAMLQFLAGEKLPGLEALGYES